MQPRIGLVEGADPAERKSLGAGRAVRPLGSPRRRTTQRSPPAHADPGPPMPLRNCALRPLAWGDGGQFSTC